MGIDLEHSTLRIRRTPLVDGSGGIEDAQLVVLVGHATGRRYIVAADLELGRGPESPVEILDDGVSRRHARISRGEHGYTIEDLGSRNGTFVNGQRVDSHPLRFGDKIAVGSRTVMLFANRDRFEQQRTQAQKLQALGQLAGGIAHDFNNLLGVVLANASHLRGMPRLEESVVRSSLAEVETAARRAVDLTRQLLAFARSSQRQHLPMSIADVVDDARRLLSRTLHRSVEISADVERELAAVGDASAVLQVLMNLCINAGDAMLDGGTLEITARAAQVSVDEISSAELLTPGRYIALTVRDSGEGIDPDVLPRIFEPFFTTKPRGQGTGLGLATAHAVVRDHGGSIRVQSVLGGGTTFTVLLPAATGQLQRKSDLVLTDEITLSAVVLLADDEELVRSSAARVLEHAGMEVILAGDGVDAVERFEESADRIELVIMDLDMPRLDGERAFAKIHANRADVPVLISSGYVGSERETALRDAGVDGILSKPYDSRTLMQAVANVLRAQRRK